MTVREYWVDSSVASNGSGTQGSPFKTLAFADAAIGHVSGDVNVLHCKSGSVFNERIPVPLSNSAGLGLHMDVYGGSKPVLVDSTAAATGWTYNATFDFWTAVVGINTFHDSATLMTIGALLEDGVCLPMRMYNSNHTALRASLTAGSYAYNKANGTVYMLPSTATPASHTYRAATLAYVMNAGTSGPYSVATDAHAHNWNRKFEGIIFKGGKAFAALVGSSKTLFEDCGFFAAGGMERTNEHIGNGIEATTAATGLVVRHCWFDQMFDTGFTPQTYDNGAFATEMVCEDSTFTRNGLSGIEVSVQGGDGTTTTTDITIRRNTIRDSINSFAPNIYAGRYRGITVVQNATGILNRINVHDNVLEDLAGGGLTVTETGASVFIDRNTVRRALFGIRSRVAQAKGSVHQVRNLTVEDCTTGIETQHSVTDVSDNFTDITVTGASVGYSDLSTVNGPVVLTRVSLGATTAVTGSRTAGITSGGGNTTTGTMGSYAYLFA